MFHVLPLPPAKRLRVLLLARMAPGLLVTDDTAAALQSQATASQRQVEKKTLGQHSPRYDLLQSYEQFPKEITGPTLWDVKDYDHNPERWTYRFDDADVAELGHAADDFIEQGRPLVEISKVPGLLRIGRVRSRCSTGSLCAS